MYHPFSRNRTSYNQPQTTNHRSFSNPIQRPSAPKVVQIPVHFVNSKPVDRSGSAVKLQKVFKGFLVRKSMKRIKNVKKQVEEIEEKLSKRESVELIKRDEKERLRVSEGLMSLLIKLDSIRGFDFGVRECRKAVIRKAIALQERVDAIVSVEKVESLDTNRLNGSENDENLVECVEKGESLDAHCLNESDNDEKLAECVEKVESLDAHCLNGSENDEKSVECVEKVESLDTRCENDGKCVEILDDFAENDGKLEGCEDSESETIVDVGVDSEVKVSEENGAKKNESLVENDEVKNEVGDWVELESDNGNRRNNELMDRMVQDNEKMMNMMKQLFDCNEKQMKMINALSHRVEMLEKAMVCDRRKKKKQKKRAASCGDE